MYNINIHKAKFSVDLDGYESVVSLCFTHMGVGVCVCVCVCVCVVFNNFDNSLDPPR